MERDFTGFSMTSFNSKDEPWEETHGKLVDLCKSCDPVNEQFAKYVKPADGDMYLHCGRKTGNFPCAGKIEYHCEKTLCINCQSASNQYQKHTDKHKFCRDCIWLYRRDFPDFALLDDAMMNKQKPVPVNTRTKADKSSRPPVPTVSAQASSSSSTRSDGIAIDDTNKELRELNLLTIDNYIKAKGKGESDRLELSDVWSLPMCGGPHIYGTAKCQQVHWYVGHYVYMTAYEEYSPEKYPNIKQQPYAKDKVMNLIKKYCFCNEADEVHRKLLKSTNMSLLSEYLPKVLTFDPFAKDSMSKDEKGKKILAIHDRSQGNQSMLIYYKKVRFSDNFMNHISNWMTKFGRAYSDGSWNHRTGYADDIPSVFLTTCIQLFNKSGEVIDSEFSAFKNRVLTTIKSRQLGLETAKFEDKDIQTARTYYPQCMQGVPDNASEEEINQAFMKIFEKFSEKKQLKTLHKTEKRMNDSRKRPKTQVAQGGSSSSNTLNDILGLETPGTGSSIVNSDSPGVRTFSIASSDAANDKVKESMATVNNAKVLESLVTSYKSVFDMLPKANEDNREFLESMKKQIEEKMTHTIDLI